MWQFGRSVFNSAIIINQINVECPRRVSCPARAAIKFFSFVQNLHEFARRVFGFYLRNRVNESRIGGIWPSFCNVTR